MSESLTLAQVQFNLYRPNRWVTVGAGSEQEVTAKAASGYYGGLRSPAGDTPFRVRVHQAANACLDGERVFARRRALLCDSLAHLVDLRQPIRRVRNRSRGW